MKNGFCSKNWSATLGFAAAMAVATVATMPESARAEVCGAAAFSTAVPAEVSWRQSSTHPMKSGEIAATSPHREQIIQQTRDWMENFILHFKGEFGVGDIPPMRLIFAEGTQFETLALSQGLNGVISRYKVRGLGPKGVVKGTLLLPVSGHRGNENARAWAKTDTYTIRTDRNPLKTPSTHHSWGREGKEADLIKDAKSLDLVTSHEVEIQLEKGVPIVLIYYRKGSAGPAGYVEGRVMEIEWDGT